MITFLLAAAAAGLPTCSGGASGTNCVTGLPTPDPSTANVQNLLQIVFASLGALAVLMIVIGALKFITSEGDPSKAANARQTMIYSVVGLVIAISAEIIVTFVLGHF